MNLGEKCRMETLQIHNDDKKAHVLQIKELNNNYLIF